MPNINFTQFHTQTINQLDQDIETLFSYIILPQRLKEACYYAISGKGKKVRPLLVASSFLSIKNYKNIKIDPNFKYTASLNTNVRRAMLAVELLHTYSLVHDDLPCMDDDNLRRGRETTHIKFDEPTALLVGDVLQSLAFEVLTSNIKGFEQADNKIAMKQLSVFAPRARRMVGGQILDLEGENKQLSQDELQSIHIDKTGALIEASVLMGAISAYATNENIKNLTKFSQNLGLAFQIQDDILDVTVDTEQLGKPAGSDEKLDKSTYVKLMGIESARQYAKTLFDESKRSVSVFGNDHLLAQLSDWLWTRGR